MSNIDEIAAAIAAADECEQALRRGDTVCDQLKELAKRKDAVEHEADSLVTGRLVRVTSEYNGQAYGSSRKPLTGKLFRVRGIAGLSSGMFGTSIWLDGQDVAINLDEVEFVEEQEVRS